MENNKERIEEIPRRIRLDLYSPAEKAIYDAMQAVEAMPASVHLSNAVVKLAEAKNHVADFIDGVPVEHTVELLEKSEENEVMMLLGRSDNALKDIINLQQIDSDSDYQRGRNAGIEEASKIAHKALGPSPTIQEIKNRKNKQTMISTPKESLDEQIEKEGYWKTPTGALMSQKDFAFLSTSEQNKCEFISKEIHKAVLDDKPFEKLYPTTPEVEEPEENILCAAIQYHERNNGVFAGRNHAEIIKEFHKIMNLNQYQAGKYTQGFLTTRGRFVNREDAASIHKANGGFCSYFGGKELDSSDLEYMKAKLNS